MTAWSAKFWYKWRFLESHPSHNSTHCRAELCSKLLCSSHRSLVPLNLLSRWIPSFRQPEYTPSSPHKTQKASEYITVLLYLGICCRGHQRRRKVKELQWLLGVLVMAEALRRRRRSRTALLALFLSQVYISFLRQPAISFRKYSVPLFYKVSFLVSLVVSFRGKQRSKKIGRRTEYGRKQVKWSSKKASHHELSVNLLWFRWGKQYHIQINDRTLGYFTSETMHTKANNMNPGLYLNKE